MPSIVIEQCLIVFLVSSTWSCCYHDRKINVNYYHAEKILLNSTKITIKYWRNIMCMQMTQKYLCQCIYCYPNQKILKINIDLNIYVLFIGINQRTIHFISILNYNLSALALRANFTQIYLLSFYSSCATYSSQNKKKPVAHIFSTYCSVSIQNGRLEIYCW